MKKNKKVLSTVLGSSVLAFSMLLTGCSLFQGVSVTGASINSKGELILSYSDGTQQNLGVVKGKDGTNGTNGSNGTNGEQGSAGESAYQTAVKNGFVGTEEEWLASLKGASGGGGGGGGRGATGATGAPGRGIKTVSTTYIDDPSDEHFGTIKITITYDDSSSTKEEIYVQKEDSTIVPLGYSGFIANTSDALKAALQVPHAYIAITSDAALAASTTYEVANDIILVNNTGAALTNAATAKLKFVNTKEEYTITVPFNTVAEGTSIGAGASFDTSESTSFANVIKPTFTFRGVDTTGAGFACTFETYIAADRTIKHENATLTYTASEALASFEIAKEHLADFKYSYTKDFIRFDTKQGDASIFEVSNTNVLQKDLEISADETSKRLQLEGYLKYVEDYASMGASNKDGHFLPLYFDIASDETVKTVNVGIGTKSDMGLAVESSSLKSDYYLIDLDKDGEFDDSDAYYNFAGTGLVPIDDDCCAAFGNLSSVANKALIVEAGEYSVAYDLSKLKLGGKLTAAEYKDANEKAFGLLVSSIQDWTSANPTFSIKNGNSISPTLKWVVDYNGWKENECGYFLSIKFTQPGEEVKSYRVSYLKEDVQGNHVQTNLTGTTLALSNPYLYDYTSGSGEFVLKWNETGLWGIRVETLDVAYPTADAVYDDHVLYSQDIKITPTFGEPFVGVRHTGDVSGDGTADVLGKEYQDYNTTLGLTAGGVAFIEEMPLSNAKINATLNYLSDFLQYMNNDQTEVQTKGYYLPVALDTTLLPINAKVYMGLVKKDNRGNWESKLDVIYGEHYEYSDNTIVNGLIELTYNSGWDTEWIARIPYETALTIANHSADWGIKYVVDYHGDGEIVKEKVYTFEGVSFNYPLTVTALTDRKPFGDYGYTGNQLQTLTITPANNGYGTIEGTLNFVENFTQFASTTPYNEGNYIALMLEVNGSYGDSTSEAGDKHIYVGFADSTGKGLMTAGATIPGVEETSPIYGLMQSDPNDGVVVMQAGGQIAPKYIKIVVEYINSTESITGANKEAKTYTTHYYDISGLECAPQGLPPA